MSIFDGVEIPSEIDMVFIDVGLSYSCPTTIEALSLFPNSFVFGFEPVKENCDRVLDKIKMLGFEKRFRLFHCAVDDVQGEVIKDFHITCNSEVEGDHGQSSLFKLKEELKDSMWVERTVPTVCVNLNSLFSKIDPIRFHMVTVLKTDTQGNDFSILKSLHKNLHRIKYIICESHTNGHYQKNRDDPLEIYDYLTSNGFEFLTDDISNPDHVYRQKGSTL
jgi:FkbM family methyltransferase